MKKTQLDIALEYAKNGIKVIACGLNKAPCVGKDWESKATTDKETIKKWFSGKENRLIGVPNNQLLILDIDDHKIHSELVRPIFNVIIESMKKHGVIDVRDDNKVKTISGGTHYYFKACPEVGRRINYIPFIDVLGDGGQTIIADQKNYKAEVAEPWNHVKNLPEFNLAALDVVKEECAEAIEILTTLEKEMRRNKKIGGRHVKSDETTNTHHNTNYYTDSRGDIKYYKKNANELYAMSERKYEIDPTEIVLNENGKIRIEPGQITSSEFLTKLSRNQSVNRAIAEALGILVPKIGGTTIQNSVIPGHADKRPSLGGRWVKENTHIVVRDFANFLKAAHDGVDYDLVRFSVACRTGSSADYVRGRPWSMLFLQLMDEVGILDIDRTQYDETLEWDTLNSYQTRVARAMINLVDYNRLFADWDGHVIFTGEFGYKATGIQSRTVNNNKKALVKKGFLSRTGKFDTNHDGRHAYIDETGEKKSSPRETDTFFVNTGVTSECGTFPSYVEDLNKEIFEERSEMYIKTKEAVVKRRREEREAKREARADEKDQEVIKDMKSKGYIQIADAKKSTHLVFKHMKATDASVVVVIKAKYTGNMNVRKILFPIGSYYEENDFSVVGNYGKNYLRNGKKHRERFPEKYQQSRASSVEFGKILAAARGGDELERFTRKQNRLDKFFIEQNLREEDLSYEETMIQDALAEKSRIAMLQHEYHELMLQDERLDAQIDAYLSGKVKNIYDCAA